MSDKYILGAEAKLCRRLRVITRRGGRVSCRLPMFMQAQEPSEMRPIAATLAAASAGALLYRWWLNTTSTEGSAQQDQQKEEVQEEQEMEEESGQQNYSVVLYYLYVEIPDTNLLRAWHEDTTSRLQLSGRVLIATEGINGTLSGSTEAVDEVNAHSV